MGAWQHALGTHNGFDPYAELAAMTGTRLSREEWAPRVSEEHWRRCEERAAPAGRGRSTCRSAALGMPHRRRLQQHQHVGNPWLERHGLRSSFDAVCTRDDVNAVKPAPDLFLLAAHRGWDVAAGRCLVFEDSPNGLRPPRRPGCGQSPFPTR